MKKLLTICFITLSFVSFTQSKKKQNELLKTEFTTLKKEQDVLLTEKNNLTSEISKSSKRVKELQIDYINIAPTYKEREDRINQLFSVSEQLKLDANVVSSGEFPDVNGIKLLINQYKEHEKNNRFSNFDIKSIDESLLLEKHSKKEQNEIYKKLIETLKFNTTDLKNNIVNYQKVLTERTAILSKIEVEMTTLKNDLSSKSWLIDYLEKEVTKAEQNFRTNGPKGFSKEYFQVFPEAFPDYTSEGIKKPTPKKEKPKTTKLIAPVIVDEVEDSDNNFVMREPDIVQESTPQLIQEVQIYEVVDETAQYPGGQEALKKYIKDNLKFPQTAIDMGIEGKCYLKFIVSQSGNISNVKVVRGVTDCPECDREAIRVVKSMPNFIPGKVNGKAVHSTFTLPVPFKL
jgi:TonB family protein